MKRAGPSRLLPFVVLGAAITVVSGAAIAIRIAQQEGAGSLAIAFWRLAIAAGLLALLAWGRSDARHALREAWSRPQRRILALCVLSGVFLALHFACWIGSLAHTSIASSMALVSTNPIWIAAFSAMFLRERIDRAMLLGIAAAVAGSALVFWIDGSAAQIVVHERPLWGNGLALAGSLTVCGYLLIGKRVQTAIAFLPYLVTVYGTAALTLGLIAWASGAILSELTPLAWGCVIALALGPQLLGHTGINWALRRLSPAFVAVATLAEPIGSTMLAWLFLGESFTSAQFAGFALLLFGIGLAARAQAKGLQRGGATSRGGVL